MGDDSQTALKAFEVATIALTKIEEHEKVCDLRYAQIGRTLEIMQKRWFVVSGAIILLLLSILGAVLTAGWEEHKNGSGDGVVENHDKR